MKRTSKDVVVPREVFELLKSQVEALALLSKEQLKITEVPPFSVYKNGELIKKEA